MRHGDRLYLVMGEAWTYLMSFSRRSAVIQHKNLIGYSQQLLYWAYSRPLLASIPLIDERQNF